MQLSARDAPSRRRPPSPQRTKEEIMRALRNLSALAFCLAALTGGRPSAAHAAAICTGSISKFPVVVTKPGVWCVKKNLTTADPAVTAIDIKTDNVTIDCNGFTLDNLAA